MTSANRDFQGGFAIFTLLLLVAASIGGP